MTLNHTKILYALNIVLFCASLGLFLYGGYAIRQASQGVQSGNRLAQPDQTTAEAIAKITVGSNTDNPAVKRLGTITQLQGDSLTLKEDPSGTLYTVSISYGTHVELLGAMKDRIEYQKEMDAYYARIKELMQDPVKNKDALGALELPHSNESKPGNIGDLAVGDSIIVIADAPISEKSFVATKIVKATVQTR